MPLNAFGLALKASLWTWTHELCSADSDGDGFSNGAELGDACCAWTSGGGPPPSPALSHPGDASSFPAASVAACAQPLAFRSAGPASHGGRRAPQVVSRLVVPSIVVPPTTTSYYAMPFAMPAAVMSAVHVVRWGANVTSALVHHFLLFTCGAGGPTEMSGPSAFEFVHGCKNLVYIWTPGSQPVESPPFAGFAIGPGTESVSFLLQIHYNNAGHVVGVVDASEVLVTWEPLAARPHDQRVVWTGAVNSLFNPSGTMPPGREAFYDAFACRCAGVRAVRLCRPSASSLCLTSARKGSPRRCR